MRLAVRCVAIFLGLFLVTFALAWLSSNPESLGFEWALPALWGLPWATMGLGWAGVAVNAALIGAIAYWWARSRTR